MICLTDEECSQWLKARGIVEKSYHKGIKTPYLFPLTYKRTFDAQELTRELVDLTHGAEALLLHIVDWAIWNDEQFALIDAVRRSHGELRELIDAPGHLYEPAERDELVGLFWLTIAFGWNSYLYSFPASNTIYNWEGDYIDIWNYDAASLPKVKELAEQINANAKHIKPD